MNWWFRESCLCFHLFLTWLLQSTLLGYQPGLPPLSPAGKKHCFLTHFSEQRDMMNGLAPKYLYDFYWPSLTDLVCAPSISEIHGWGPAVYSQVTTLTEPRHTKCLAYFKSLLTSFLFVKALYMFDTGFYLDLFIPIYLILFRLLFLFPLFSCFFFAFFWFYLFVKLLRRVLYKWTLLFLLVLLIQLIVIMSKVA